MEIWKDIEGYEGLYQVSNLGRVKSLQRMVKHSDGNLRMVNERILKAAINFKGYKVVALQKGGLKTFIVHRLVALAFIPNPESKKQVNHKNGIKTDNQVENLEWSTASENVIHAYENKLTYGQKGETNGKAKITKLQAMEIKYSYKDISLIKIAEKFDVSLGIVKNIRSGRTWKHI